MIDDAFTAHQTPDRGAEYRQLVRQRVYYGTGGTVPQMDAPVDLESSFELLRRAQDGDTDALDRLLQRHLPALRRWARGRLPRWARDLADTQDLVQETTLQALKRLPTFRPQRDGALQAYLRQAVMNRIRDEIRRAHRRTQAVDLDENFAGDMVSPLEEAIGHETLNKYEAALAQLRAQDREAVIARVEFGYSYAEVAAALGKPSPDAARVAVQRALVRLAEKMNR